MLARLRKHKPADPALRDFARGQRHDMPTVEALFRQQVRAGRFRGLKFKRQVPIPPFATDFVCLSARLIVELDGPLHADETRKRHAARRDACLKSQGFTVLRFPNDLVLDAVGAAIDACAKSPPPSAVEGGPRSGSGQGSAASGEIVVPRPPCIHRIPSPAKGGGE